EKLPSLRLLDPSGITLNAPSIQLTGGAFSIKGLAPSQYLLDFRSLPETAYVKSIRLGDQDVTHAPVELSIRSTANLEIVLSPKAAEISGTAAPDVLVTLWPKMPDEGNPTRGSRSARVGDDGSFSIKSLAPGDYFIAAWSEGETGLLESREFVTQFD